MTTYAQTSSDVLDLTQANEYFERAVTFWVTTFVDGKLDLITRENFAADYEFNGQRQDLSQIQTWCQWLIDTYKGHKVTFLEGSFASGQQVALHWSFEGERDCKAVSTEGINLLKYNEKGQCVSNWQVASPAENLIPPPS